jgi:hypothetical protein
MKQLNYHLIEPKVLRDSQKGQDSLIEYTFDLFGTTNKYYVEFGACDGYAMSNTSHLRESKGWSGLLLEGDSNWTKGNPSINLHNRNITKDNICNIFKEFNVPINHDFLCIDMDGVDYWIMKSILEGQYKPRVIMIETNVRFEAYESMTLKYIPDWRWDYAKWYGASPYALKKLFNLHGYVPVWIHLDDMIVIRKDILEENGYAEPDWRYVYPKSNVPLYDGHKWDGKFYTKFISEEWQEV